MLPVLAALSFMLLQNQAPAVPAIVKDPDYPLRVQVAETGASGANGKLTEYGHGNVLGPPVDGFDYTQDCNQRFAARPEADQYFRARWKKQGRRLKILIQEMGSDRIFPCDLKVAMREQPYELNASRVGAGGVALDGSTCSSGDRAGPELSAAATVLGYVVGLQQYGAHAEGYGDVIGPRCRGSTSRMSARYGWRWDETIPMSIRLAGWSKGFNWRSGAGGRHAAGERVQHGRGDEVGAVSGGGSDGANRA